MEGRQTVPLENVVLAQAFQLEALLNVLERRGVVWKAEVLEEMKRSRPKTPQGTYSEALDRLHEGATQWRNGAWLFVFPR